MVEPQEEGEENESSQDEEMPSQERNAWPTLFGDTTSIWKSVKTKERNEDKVNISTLPSAIRGELFLFVTYVVYYRNNQCATYSKKLNENIFLSVGK